MTKHCMSFVTVASSPLFGDYDPAYVSLKTPVRYTGIAASDVSGRTAGRRSAYL